MTKDEIKRKYNLPSFRTWKDVPVNYHTRTSALREKIIIPVNAKPDAVKNSSSTLSKDKIYFLYDINKYSKEE